MGCPLVFSMGHVTSWVDFSLYTENQLCTMPGSALKVCVVVVGGWVVLKVNLVINFGYSLALAKPNNYAAYQF